MSELFRRHLEEASPLRKILLPKTATFRDLARAALLEEDRTRGEA